MKGKNLKFIFIFFSAFSADSAVKIREEK